MNSLDERHIKFLKDEYGVSDIDALDDNAFDELLDKLAIDEEKEIVENKNYEKGDLIAEIKDYMIDAFEYDDDTDAEAKADGNEKKLIAV